MGEPLYVALDDVYPPTYTGVKNGASTATFMYGNGDTVTLDSFYVLVLLHDAVDWDPNSGAETHVSREGAMDPTGPVFWRSFWPIWDPSIHFSPDFLEAWKPRERLEPCFEEFKRHIRDGDSFLEAEIKLKRALTSSSSNPLYGPRWAIDSSEDTSGGSAGLSEYGMDSSSESVEESFLSESGSEDADSSLAESSSDLGHRR